jgi:hypothetical protein
MARRAVEQKRWFPFGPRNWRMLGIAALCIVVGMVLAGIGPYDSFWSLTLSPLFLFAGYFVLIPLAILLPSEKTSGD